MLSNIKLSDPKASKEVISLFKSIRGQNMQHLAAEKKKINAAIAEATEKISWQQIDKMCFLILAKKYRREIVNELNYLEELINDFKCLELRLISKIPGDENEELKYAEKTLIKEFLKDYKRAMDKRHLIIKREYASSPRKHQNADYFREKLGL